MLNVICLVGRIVHDPELKQTNSGSEVTTFTVAVERNRAGQDGQRTVDYIDIVAWRKTAEFVCKYFRKGSWIAVNGSLQTRSFEDKNGNKRKIFEVVADNVHFAGSKAEAADSGEAVAPHGSVDSLESRLQELNEAEDDSDLPF